MEFKSYGISQVGGRKGNEDYFSFRNLSQYSCWVVADGLGGHGGGEVASQTAVEKILESFVAAPGLSYKTIQQYISSAQAELVMKQQQNPALSAMRTTLVVLVTDYNSVLWAHMGDSRLYYFKSGRIVMRTKDHSVPQALADAGVISNNQIRFHEDRNRVLRALGKEGDLRPEIYQLQVPVSEGDAFLLCTDGFWEHITETEMEVDLVKAKAPQHWLELMEMRYLQRIGQEQDNYTALAIFIM